jgi:protein AFG1
LKSRCDVVELDGGRDWRSGTGLQGEADVVARWYERGSQGFEDAWTEGLEYERQYPYLLEILIG